jgi:hypothetical protein
MPDGWIGNVCRENRRVLGDSSGNAGQIHVHRTAMRRVISGQLLLNLGKKGVYSSYTSPWKLPLIA